jgi:glutaryl-CoA dehydrogenase
MSSPPAAHTPRRATADAEDVFRLDDTLSEQERELRDRVRAFGDEHVLPVINDYWERAEFPFELVAPLAELGVVGGPLGSWPGSWRARTVR